MLEHNRELKQNEIVDHIDGNTSNNDPSNLRLVTNEQNGRNRSRALSRSKSKLIGVVWNDIARKWRSSIRVSGKLHHLGYFEDAVAAVTAYWNFRKYVEPAMWKTWKAQAEAERRKARNLFNKNCGPDGKKSKVSQQPLVSGCLLHKLIAKNDGRMNLATTTTSILKAVRVRFMIYKDRLIWRAASGKNSCVGGLAGTQRKDDGRVVVEFLFGGKRVSMNTSVIAWMLHTRKIIDSGTKILHLDGNRFNVAKTNMRIVIGRR